MQDEELDLCGVIFVGSPQVNSEKFYVSNRLGMMVEAMDVDGAIITTEGFGNNHIDFASHHEQIGSRGVAVVGVSYSAVQGALVVGNEYMKYMVDNNKSKQGIENEILANNTLSPEDAIRAVAMLKTVMAGEEVKVAERKWNPNVKLNNVEMIEKAYGMKIELEDNEQVLRSEYPQLKVDFVNNQASLNDKELNLNPTKEDVKNDVDLFLKYMSGYNKFHGDVFGLQYRYFDFANWFFCSPEKFSFV